MQDIDFSTAAVLLRGPSLSGQITMTNKNENLSIMYEIVSIPARFLDVSPDRGIIMSEQTKKIRIRVPLSSRNNLSLSNTKMELVIHTTMNSQYNRKIMKQRKMQGWNQVQNTFETFTIPVLMGNDIGFQGQQMIRESRKQGYSASSVKSNKEQDYIRRSIQRRQSLSKIRSRNQSNIPDLNRDPSLRNKKLNSQLDFLVKKQKSSNFLNLPIQNENNMARLDIQQSRKNSQAVSPIATGRNSNGEFILKNFNMSGTSSMKQSRKSLRNPLNIQISPYPEDQNDPLATVLSPTVTINSPMLKGVISNSPESNESPSRSQFRLLGIDQQRKVSKQQNQRGLEILILAIVAGFFVALGSNIGRLFS